MRFPYLTNIPSSTNTIDVFGGYNHNHRISENEFFDMGNMTSDHYPLLAPRKPRGIKKLFEDGAYSGTIAAVTELNGKWYVLTVPTRSEGPNGEIKLYADGEEVYSQKNNIDPDQKRYIVKMGSMLIVFPDKFFYNTTPTKKEEEGAQYINESGSLDAYTETIEEQYSYFTLCKLDGTDISYALSKPEEAEDGDYWFDTEGETGELKRWSKDTWVTEPTTYTKIKLPVISQDFKEGDGVKISYRPKDDESAEVKETSVIIEKVYDTKQADECSDFIVIRGLLDAEYTVVGQAENKYHTIISRKCPEMDLVIESGNRLWGCKFGQPAVYMSPVNEIYASALGDPTNWNIFEGTSMDSYVMSLGSAGEFTGAVSYRGYPIFFKENCIHKIYGSYPANYQIQTIEARGVQKGSNESLAVINEVLYYKAADTVCAYEGTLPIDVGEPLGSIKYYSAIGAGRKDKYYVSMKDGSDNSNLFVYDTRKGIWHKEDNFEARGFISTSSDLYTYKTTSSKKAFDLVALCGSEEKYENKVKWYAETGKIGLSNTSKKKLKNIKVRLSVPVGSRARISVEYDSSGRWEQVYMKSGTRLDAFSVPIKPKKCDHFRLKFEGEGDVKIFALDKTIEYTGGVK